MSSYVRMPSSCRLCYYAYNFCKKMSVFSVCNASCALVHVGHSASVFSYATFASYSLLRACCASATRRCALYHLGSSSAARYASFSAKDGPANMDDFR